MESNTSAPPISANLMRIAPDTGAVTLLAGRHRESGRLVFPLPQGPDWAAEELPQRGSLWSWTVQRFRPKSPPYAGPDDFVPYAVGYIDLGPLIVEGRLTGAALDGFCIGMPMRVVALPIALIGPPRKVVSYAFAPDTEGDMA
ncbi:MAG: OB-fold domain-containing protein [Burkholderiaceae bacterium]|nr:OB-fold domain-containing protein [Burkholderiaceae bacterium]